MDLLSCLDRRPFPRLRCEKERLAMTTDPTAEADLRFSVTGSQIHVIDPIGERQFESRVGFGLSDLSKGCPA